MNSQPTRFMFFAAVVFLGVTSGSAMAAAPCCRVTEIAAGGHITAAERNGTRKFQFRITDRALLRGLRIGSPVYANFANGQVSLDGRSACCRILRIATAPAPVSAPPAARATPPQQSPAAKRSTTAPVIASPAISPMLAAAVPPRLSFGTPQSLPPADWRVGHQRLLQYQHTNVAQLRGNDEIKRATGLPQAAKDILWLHARTLEAQELDSYIVIPERAQAWANELPDEMREVLRKAATDDGKKKKKGCSVHHISTGCARNEVDQAVDDLTRAARKAWDDTVNEWGRLMGTVDEARQCFREQTLSAKGPVYVGIAPQIALSFERDSKSSGKHGSTAGSVRGNVTIDLPVKVDTVAQLDVFYIPCLPFAIRPKSLGANGSLGVEGIFDASVVATGEFDRLFTVPPAGGVQIPVAVIPIALGGVPIAVIDVSVYLDGSLRVDGEGSLRGNLKVQSLQLAEFGFDCSGHGCRLDARAVPAPVNSFQSANLDGRIRLKPAIYSALQLGLNYNVLNVRAGPQPFLLGEIRGCIAAAAAQDTAGASSSEALHALTADLDWGIEVRAEALAGGEKLAQKKWLLQQEHLYFADLGRSTALVPMITGAAHASTGQSAAFAVKMPSCYPYTDAMQYRVRWTGDAGAPSAAPSQATLVRALPSRGSLPAPGAANTDCTLESGQGSCRGAPQNDTLLYLAWPASGDYRLTVAPLEDAHGRRFDAASTAEWAISVTP